MSAFVALVRHQWRLSGGRMAAWCAAGAAVLAAVTDQAPYRTQWVLLAWLTCTTLIAAGSESPPSPYLRCMPIRWSTLCRVRLCVDLLIAAALTVPVSVLYAADISSHSNVFPRLTRVQCLQLLALMPLLPAVNAVLAPALWRATFRMPFAGLLSGALGLAYVALVTWIIGFSNASLFGTTVIGAIALMAALCGGWIGGGDAYRFALPTPIARAGSVAAPQGRSGLPIAGLIGGLSPILRLLLLGAWARPGVLIATLAVPYLLAKLLLNLYGSVDGYGSGVALFPALWLVFALRPDQIGRVGAATFIDRRRAFMAVVMTPLAAFALMYTTAWTLNPASRIGADDETSFVHLSALGPSDLGAYFSVLHGREDLRVLMPDGRNIEVQQYLHERAMSRQDMPRWSKRTATEQCAILVFKLTGARLDLGMIDVDGRSGVLSAAGIELVARSLASLSALAGLAVVAGGMLYLVVIMPSRRNAAWWPGWRRWLSGWRGALVAFVLSLAWVIFGRSGETLIASTDGRHRPYMRPGRISARDGCPRTHRSSPAASSRSPRRAESWSGAGRAGYRIFLASVRPEPPGLCGISARSCRGDSCRRPAAGADLLPVFGAAAK